jgi:hypothetical protein
MNEKLVLDFIDSACSLSAILGILRSTPRID